MGIEFEHLSKKKKKKKKSATKTQILAIKIQLM